MIPKTTYQSPIVWRSAYDQMRRRLKCWLILIHLFYAVMLLGLMGYVLESERKVETFSVQMSRIEEYRAREVIYSILKGKGISLNQALDIAEVTIRQSRELGIPLPVILAVMKKESLFDTRAVSPKRAMGLMQIHPITWTEYAGKLKLDASNYAPFDPVTNVTVGTQLLKDLYDFYGKTARSESELWDCVLSAYYAGKYSVAQTGMNASHKRYVADVNRFKNEFERQFSNQNRKPGSSQ